MKRRRRVEISVETDKRFVIRRSRGIASVPCAHCAGELVTPEEAVTVAGISSRAIHRRAERGEIHFAETPEGLLLVCLNSLSTSREEQ